MKKLLTTALVLAMLMSMFCMSPAVTAAETPEMNISIMNVPSEDDTISAEFNNVGNASWVTWSVKAKSTDEYIFMDEKRGNKAQAEGFSFLFASNETDLKALVNFVAEATVVYADGTKVPLTKEFEYKTYNQVQVVIREILTGAKTISAGAAELSRLLPGYYVNTVDTAVLAALNATYAAELANPYDPADVATHIEPQGFYAALNSEILKATINSGSAAAIQNLLDVFYGDVGVAVADQEKIWYDADADRAAIASKLAEFNYDSVVEFKEQFKTVSFLKKLSSVASTDIIDFIKLYNNRYTNFGTDTTLVSGTVTNLDVATYDTLATTETRKEYAKTYMAIGYTNLNDLETRWAELLRKLPEIAEPSAPSIPVVVPPVGGGVVGGASGISKPTVSVGLEQPLVGEKALPFTDLDNVLWAKEAIAALYAEGVIEGVSAKAFLPNAEVTREQFIKIIINTYGLKGTGKACSFEDVNQSAWYAPYINTAVELGIVNGISETEFGIGASISRQDMTVLLYRISKYLGYEIKATGKKSVNDIDSIADYAKEAVDTFYKAGIVNGVAEGVFAGTQTATRAQAAKLCYDLREANK